MLSFCCMWYWKYKDKESRSTWTCPKGKIIHEGTNKGLLKLLLSTVISSRSEHLIYDFASRANFRARWHKILQTWRHIGNTWNNLEDRWPGGWKILMIITFPFHKHSKNNFLISLHFLFPHLETDGKKDLSKIILGGVGVFTFRMIFLSFYTTYSICLLLSLLSIFFHYFSFIIPFHLNLEMFDSTLSIVFKFSSCTFSFCLFISYV